MNDYRSHCYVVTSVPTVVVPAKLVKIGNSTGIRLPKPLLDIAGLLDAIEIKAKPAVLTIRPSAHPRAGWEEVAAPPSHSFFSMR